MKTPLADGSCGSTRKKGVFDQTATDRLPIVHECEAFSCATGLSFSLGAPGVDAGGALGGGSFCRCVAATPRGCRMCAQTRQQLERRAARDVAPMETTCFAGLVDMAVPVANRGELLATLWVSPFLREPPTKERFADAVQPVRRELSAVQESEARAAYFHLPVVSRKREETIQELLVAMASFLAVRIAATADLGGQSAPPAVDDARGFVASHLDEPLSLDVVARHVHLSRFHFCRLFKNHTGVTLKDYVNQHRVIKAAALLENPNLRIIEIAFSVGFGSVSHFDHVFRHAVGLSPKAYRALRFAIRGPTAIPSNLTAIANK